MQGTVLAPLKCSTQIDSIGRDCFETNAGLFKYKDCVSIPPLSMIDDILAVADCDYKAIEVNAIIQKSKSTLSNLSLEQINAFSSMLVEI
jgi:hypothetical protein